MENSFRNTDRETEKRVMRKGTGIFEHLSMCVDVRVHACMCVEVRELVTKKKKKKIQTPSFASGNIPPCTLVDSVWIIKTCDTS